MPTEADGSGDSTFDAGENGAAGSLGVRPDGKLLLLVGGDGLDRAS